MAASSQMPTGMGSHALLMASQTARALWWYTPFLFRASLYACQAQQWGPFIGLQITSAHPRCHFLQDAAFYQPRHCKTSSLGEIPSMIYHLWYLLQPTGSWYSSRAENEAPYSSASLIQKCRHLWHSLAPVERRKKIHYLYKIKILWFTILLVTISYTHNFSMIPITNEPVLSFFHSEFMIK